MTGKKRKLNQATPDLTLEAGALTVFTDKPRGGSIATSPGVVKSYDPAVPALAKRGKRETTEESHIKSLAKILENCLRTAESIKEKRGTELVKLLRDARRQVELIDLR